MGNSSAASATTNRGRWRRYTTAFRVEVAWGDHGNQHCGPEELFFDFRLEPVSAGQSIVPPRLNGLAGDGRAAFRRGCGSAARVHCGLRA